MKLFKTLIAAAAVLSLSSCDFGPALIYQAQMPEFKPIDGKARLVLIRPKPGFSISLGGSTNPNDIITSVYLDAKYVSETYFSTVVSFPVEPGEHYIFARSKGFGMAKPMGKVKFNFQAGKVYYLNLKVAVAPTPVGEVQSCLLDPIAIDEATKLLTEKKDLRYGEFDTSKKRDDLDQKEFASLERDYSKWVNDKPNDAKKESEYPGY